MIIILQNNRFYPPHLTSSLFSTIRTRLEERLLVDVRNSKTRSNSLRVSNEGGEYT